MNLKHWKLVAKPALPFLNNTMTAEIFNTLDVNGALIDASVSDKAKPESAYLRAPQSLAPSPTIQTVRFDFCNNSINCVLLFGRILAKTIVRKSRVYKRIG